MHMRQNTKRLCLKKIPVICKLPDFGEEKPEMAQTKTLLSNKTKLVEKRTPAFVTPQISTDAYLCWY